MKNRVLTQRTSKLFLCFALVLLLIGGFAMQTSFVYAEEPPADPATAPTPTVIDAISFLNILQNIVSAIVPFIIGLAVLMFLYGLFQFISSAGDEESRKNAKQLIIWSVIGLFVMISVWGFVNILVFTFNLNNSNAVLTEVYAPADIPTTAPTTIVELINRVNAIGTRVIPFLIGLGVFIVILGIFNYIREADNEEKRAEARKFIIWGVISIFIMLSVWGLVNILIKTFQLDNKVPPLNTIFDSLKI